MSDNADRITQEAGGFTLPLPANRIVEGTGAPALSNEIPLLDGAIPLVRDEPWIWHALFMDDINSPTDLSGKTVTAELRWQVGEVEPLVEAIGNGYVRLSLTTEQTAGMPFGQLLDLYLAIDTDTEAKIPVTVLEGRYS